MVQPALSARRFSSYMRGPGLWNPTIPARLGEMFHEPAGVAELLLGTGQSRSP
jgi:hypothetical protein